MNYKMEELLSVVAMLARKTTSGESTSIPYETAQKLMGAVIYCIRLGEEEEETEKGMTTGGELPAKQNFPAGKRITAKEAYQKGFCRLTERMNVLREQYNEMAVSFQAFGNENYYDTVTKALPGFFRFYDARFAPQDTVITMDYPTLLSVGQKTGICALEAYVGYISLEQHFFARLPAGYVSAVLESWQSSYRKQFYNICRVVLRQILGNALIRKPFCRGENRENYRLMEDWVLQRTRPDMKRELEQVLERLVRERYQGDWRLYAYLKHDLEDFTVELLNAVKYQEISRVVVL